MHVILASALQSSLITPLTHSLIQSWAVLQLLLVSLHDATALVIVLRERERERDKKREGERRVK